jgi:hypothetical protein
MRCKNRLCFSGSQSDEGVFSRGIGHAVESGQVDFPPSRNVPGMTQNVPYYFVANAAFPQQTWLMKPYPGDHLQIQNCF